MPIAKGLDHALRWGKAIGCNAVQIFTKSPGQWSAKPLTDAGCDQFRAAWGETGVKYLVVHDAYLINLAAPRRDILTQSRQAFLDEMKRAEALGIRDLVTHQGAHLGAGEEEGLRRLAESVHWLLERTPQSPVHITLETTAGQGTCLGARFEHIATVLDLLERGNCVAADRVNVCLDTCHLFAAGYDIRTRAGFQKTLRDFDRVVGLSRLAVIHANDSQKPLGSRVDRHAHIGKGLIGIEAFRALMTDRRLRKVPKIVETPELERMHEVNVRVLKDLAAAHQSSYPTDGAVLCASPAGR